MANFLLLYTGGKMPEGEAETKQVMEAWGQWFGKLGDGVVDAGHPSSPHSKPIDTDRSASAAPAQVSGHSRIKPPSLHEASGQA